MPVMLPGPPLDRRRGRRQTAFERNLLPGFARWFVAQVEQHRPDYLIPAETKGARLLEEVLAYARDVLGTPIDVPVLYVTALAYMDPEVLRGCRVLILDDTVKTGKNLQRHRRRVERFGARHATAIACVGQASPEGEPPAVPCYRLVDGDRYRDYVWQLTELVVARGLPPEVDHQVFALRLPARLPVAWRTLEAALGRYGIVSVDGPRRSEEDIVGITLHFPRLPGSATHPTEGPVRNEGVSKVRFFPDPANDCIHVVPVSFPALELPAGTPPELPIADARELVRTWTQHEDDVGERLLEEARTRDPETLFRILSTSTEVDLVCGLARALARVFPHGEVELRTERGLLHRLYGTEAGERIACRVDDDVRAALQESDDEAPAEPEARSPLPLVPEVVDTTREIAIGLKQLYSERVGKPGQDPARRIGRSLSEIEQAHAGLERLLASRCLDYSLAMTTLVPYIDVELRADGSVLVLRKYRVSENHSQISGYQDIADVDQQLSEETVALIAHYLRTRSARHRGRPIPTRLIGQLAAILRPLALEQFGIPLRAQPGRTEPELVLREDARPVTLLGGQVSEMFELAGGVVPTPHFEQLYDRDRLILDLRGYSVEVESYLDLLLQLLDDEAMTDEERDVVLASWATSTDLRLGLTDVQHKLRLALAELRTPLKLMLRGAPHDRTPEFGEQARALATAATDVLEQLTGDWAAAARDRWQQPSKRERQLLASLGAPAEPTALFEVPQALAAMVACMSRLVEGLEAASLQIAGDGADEQAVRVAQTALAAAERIERTLTTLADDDGSAPTAPADPRAAIAAGAAALLRVVDQLGAFAAATVGAFGGIPVGAYEDAEGERTVLFADIARSKAHSLRHDADVDADWKSTCLNLVAQWGKAFGGRERQGREGDAIWLELSRPGDPAVLCAAAVQVHTRGLRTLGVARVSWGLYVAVNHDQLRNRGGHVMGVCLDVAAELAKQHKQDDDAITRVLVRPQAWNLCSPALRELLPAFREPVVIAPDEPDGSFVPREAADPAAIVRRWCAHVSAAAATIAAGASEPQAGAGPVVVESERGDSG